jgi:hypothetical protein
MAAVAFLVALSCGKKLPVSTGPTEGFDRVVLAELFTTVWCANCPEAEAALDRLYDEEGSTRLAVVHWHPSGGQGDPFSFPFADARNTLYGVDAYPTAWFNGLIRVRGAASDPYDEYRADYESEASRRSPIGVAISSAVDGDSVTVQVTVEAALPPPATTLNLVVVIVEHEAPNPSPTGPDTLSYVARAAFEETISISEGDTLVRTTTFVLDGSWRREMLHVVAFAQNPDDDEVVQAAMVYMNAAVPQYAFSLTAPDTTVTIQTGDTVLTTFSLSNIGASDDSLTIDLPVSLQTVPASWIVSLCDTSGVCFVTPFTLNLPSGESVSSIGVDVIADVEGTGTVGVVVSSRGDGSLVDTLTFVFTAQVAPQPYGVELFSSDTIQSEPVGTPMMFNFTVTNTGYEPDTVWLDIPGVINPRPIGWTFSICDTLGSCFPAPYAVFLSGGASAGHLVVDVVTGMDTSAVVTLVAWSDSDPSHADTQRFYATATTPELMP